MGEDEGEAVGDMSSTVVPVTLTMPRPLLSFNNIRYFPLATDSCNLDLALSGVMPSDTVMVYISIISASSLRVELLLLLLLLLLVDTVTSVTACTEDPSAAMMLNSTADAKSLVEVSASDAPEIICNKPYSIV